jgi:hypothetical protein
VACATEPAALDAAAAAEDAAVAAALLTNLGSALTPPDKTDDEVNESLKVNVVPVFVEEDEDKVEGKGARLSVESDSGPEDPTPRLTESSYATRVIFLFASDPPYCRAIASPWAVNRSK